MNREVSANTKKTTGILRKNAFFFILLLGCGMTARSQSALDKFNAKVDAFNKKMAAKKAHNDSTLAKTNSLLGIRDTSKNKLAFFNPKTTPAAAANPGTPAAINPNTLVVITQQNYVSNIDNGIDFSLTGCTGDAAGQTVTITFVFANPRKVHQRLIIGASNAFDNGGTEHRVESITLGQNPAHPSGQQVELPTGLSVSGSYTYSNVLPNVTQLSLVSIAEYSSNWNGGGDGKRGNIELRNIPIIWNK